MLLVLCCDVGPDFFIRTVGLGLSALPTSLPRLLVNFLGWRLAGVLLVDGAVSMDAPPSERRWTLDARLGVWLCSGLPYVRFSRIARSGGAGEPLTSRL